MSNSIHKKEQKQKKNGDTDGKALYKVINNVAYSKNMENVRDRIDVRLPKIV